MTSLDSIFKSRDITLPTKVRLVKATVFPVVMYGCESRTVKKAECRRIDAFELCCWRRLCKEIQPVHSKDWKTNTNTMETPTGSSGGNAIIIDQHKPQLWKRTHLTGAVATKNETTASNTLEGMGEINTVTFSAFLSSSTLLISCWCTYNPNPTPKPEGKEAQVM